MPPLRTIGVLSPLIGGHFFGGLLAGIANAAHQQQANVIAAQTFDLDIAHHNQHLAERIFDLSLAWEHVDGWIVILDAVNEAYLRRIQDSGKPFVTLNALWPGIDCPTILPDNYGGTRTAVEHLLTHDHQRVGFVGSLMQEDMRQRYEGYRAALKEAGIAFDPRFVFETDDNIEDGGRKAAREMIEAGLPCSAVVVATDLNALGLMKELTAAGYNVPDDVAVVGFDDITIAEQSKPALTTLRQRFPDLGAKAADILLQRLDGNETAKGPVYVPTKLIVRNSCGCGLDAPSVGLKQPKQPAVTPWSRQLERELVALALYPQELNDGVEPELLWPTVSTLANLLVAAIEGRQGASLTQLMQAVQDMMRLQPTLESLSSMVTCLRDAAAPRLAQSSDQAGALERVNRLLDRIALEMFRARLIAEADQHDYDQAIIRNNYAISTQSFENDATYVRGLDWLRFTGMHCGLLGLWHDTGKRTELKVAGEYRAGTQPPTHLDRIYPTTAFPPPELLDLAAPASSDITMLLPIRTTADWGVLAFVGPIEDKLLSGREGFGLWGTLLGSALEREDLHKSLTEQQRTLHAAYERERQLADTVRELGSPIIPLLPGVLLVPLIGVIDTNRAQHVLSDILQAVETNRARHLLLDLTGVPVVDVSVANTLIQATRAVALLGAQTALVGIRPETAQSITALGVQLHHIQTYPSLAMVIQHLLAQTGSSPRRFGSMGQPTNRGPL